MTSRIIQLLIHPEIEYAVGKYIQKALVALCEDGTIWVRLSTFDRLGNQEGAYSNFRIEWVEIPLETIQKGDAWGQGSFNF